MQYSKNYKFKKPEASDVVNINDFNENVDVIDDKIKQLNDIKVSKVKGKQLSTEDYTTEEKHKLLNVEKGVSKNQQEIANIKQNTEDINKMSFEMNGERIKSTWGSGGECSDVKVYGGGLLNNLVDNGVNYGNWIVEGNSTKSKNGIHIDKNSGRIVELNIDIPANTTVTLITNITAINGSAWRYSFRDENDQALSSGSETTTGIKYRKAELSSSARSLWIFMDDNELSGSTTDFQIYGIVQGNSVDNPNILNIIQSLEYGLNYSQNIKLVSEGENIFDKEKSLIYGKFNEFGEIIPATTSVISHYISIHKGMKLYRNIKTTTWRDNYVIYDNNKNIIKVVNNPDSYVNRIDCIVDGYIRVQILPAEVETYMLTESQTLPSTYALYQSSTLDITTPEQYPFTKLPNNTRNKIRFNNGEWQYDVNVEKLILTGSEDECWEQDVSQKGNNTSIFYTKNHITENRTGELVPIAYLQNFKYDYVYLPENDCEAFFVSTSGAIWIRISNNKASTTTELKKWLSINNLEFIGEKIVKFIIPNHTQGFHVNGQLSSYLKGRLLQIPQMDKYITLDEQNSIQLDQQLSALDGVYYDNDIQKVEHALLDDTGYIINFSTTITGKYHIKGELANGIPVEIHAELSGNLKTQINNNIKANDNNSKDIARLNTDVEQIKQDTQNVQKITFEMNGESIKSVPVRGGGCSNEVVHGGIFLNNIIKYNPNTFEQFLTSDGIVTSDATGVTITSDGNSFSGINIDTSVQKDYNYGIIFNVVETTLKNNMYSGGGNTFPFSEIVFNGTTNTGIKAYKITANNTFTNNNFRFSTLNTESEGNKIKINNIRLYELPSNSQIEQDFESLTPSELNDKYPYVQDFSYPQNVKIVGEGENIFNLSVYKSIPSWNSEYSFLDSMHFGIKTTGISAYITFMNIKVKPNTNYSIHYEFDKPTNVPECFIYGQNEMNQRYGDNRRIGEGLRTFNTSNYDLIGILVYGSKIVNEIVTISNLQIIEGSTPPKQYIPYQSSALKIQTPEQYPFFYESYVDIDNSKYYSNWIKYIPNSKNLIADDFGIIYSQNNTIVRITRSKAKFIKPYGNYSISDDTPPNFHNNLYVTYKNKRLRTSGYSGFRDLDEMLCGFEETSIDLFLGLQHSETCWDSKPSKQDVLIFLDNNPIIMYYKIENPIILDNNEQGFHITGKLDTFPNGRIRMEGYYNKNYTLSDTNTIELNEELSELTSVQMYMNDPLNKNGNKILVSLDANLKDSKTIVLDKKYTGIVKVEGRPKYYVNPSLSCNIATNLGAEINGLKADQNMLSKQVDINFSDQNLINLQNDYRITILENK